MKYRYAAKHKETGEWFKGINGDYIFKTPGGVKLAIDRYGRYERDTHREDYEIHRVELVSAEVIE